MSIFDITEDLGETAENTIKSYTPSAQENAPENTPESADKTPASDSEVKALHEATSDNVPFYDVQSTNERSPVFNPPTEFVHPIQKQRARQRMTLPSIASLNDLDSRVSAVLRFDRAPEDVEEAAQRARLAIGEAREVYDAARHPEQPRYAASVEAKDRAQIAIAEATMTVSALERVADAAADRWFDSLTEGLDKQRTDALKALRAAEKAYAALRSNINGAQALAIKQGRWDKAWHQSVVTEAQLNAPIAEMRAAIGFLADGDDFTNGSFLTAEYEAIPPHTLARLEKGARATSPGSFAWQVLSRAKKIRPSDRDAVTAVETKTLLTLMNSQPLSYEQVDASMGYAPRDGDHPNEW